MIEFSLTKDVDPDLNSDWLKQLPEADGDRAWEWPEGMTQEQFKALGGKGSGNFGHAGRPGKVGGSAPRSFNPSEWKDMEFMERREKWGALDIRQRDKMANAREAIKERVATVTEFAGERPAFNENIDKSIDARCKQLRELVPFEARDAINATAHEYETYLEQAGVDAETRHELAMEAVDAMFVQENEALGRSLGDHGIAHIRGDINMSLSMLDEMPGDIGADDIAEVYSAGIFHDMGYLAAPSHYFLDEGHQRWSMQHYNENIKPLIKKALSPNRADELSHIIRTHDSTDINWTEDPMGSAFRVSDNLALFQKEKLPGLFRYVPENNWVLEQYGAGKISLDDAKEAMTHNVSVTSFNKYIKHELTRSIQEVSPVLPKLTLGMKAGEYAGVEWKDDHIAVSFRKTPQYDYLTKSLDVGQKQFAKLAETYGVDPNTFVSDLSFSYKDQSGRTLLEGIVINKDGLKAMGGKGSGNFGHAGRPGKVGGSGPSHSYGLTKDGRQIVTERTVHSLGRKIPDELHEVIAKEYDRVKYENSNITGAFEGMEEAGFKIELQATFNKGVVLPPTYFVEEEALAKLDERDRGYPNKMLEGSIGVFVNPMITTDQRGMIALDGNTDYPNTADLTIGSMHVDKSITGVLRHETGHLVDYMLAANYPQVSDYWNALAFAVHESGQTSMLMSMYADASPKEMFAECFCAFTHPKYKSGDLPGPIEHFMENITGRKANVG